VWPEISIISRNNGNKIVATGIRIQNYLNKQYQKVLPKDAAAFLSGVVLGSKQELTEGFDDSLKITGTTHIIVASGYNISILIGVLLKIFNRLRKFTLAIIVTIALVCFVAISGWDASIIRASIMASLAMVATTLGRQNYALYCLMATAVIMLIINPMWLLDTGFQLSFLATAGIILFQSEIIKKLSILPGWASESLSTTVSAQILVLPIIAVTFGQISLISLITNVLVLWITPVLMFGGLLLSIVMLASYSLGSMLALIIYPAFWYVKQIISITAQIPFAILTMKLGWATVALYYVIVYLIYWRWNNNEQI